MYISGMLDHTVGNLWKKWLFGQIMTIVHSINICGDCFCQFMDNFAVVRRGEMMVKIWKK